MSVKLKPRTRVCAYAAVRSNIGLKAALLRPTSKPTATCGWWLYFDFYYHCPTPASERAARPDVHLRWVRQILLIALQQHMCVRGLISFGAHLRRNAFYPQNRQLGDARPPPHLLRQKQNENKQTATVKVSCRVARLLSSPSGMKSSPSMARQQS